MPRGNPSPKLAITIRPEIHDAVIRAAVLAGVSVSAWDHDCCTRSTAARAGLAAVAFWEKQHGVLTADEMEDARRVVKAQFAMSRKAKRPA